MKLYLLGLLLSASSVFAQQQSNVDQQTDYDEEEQKDMPEGWSFDVGGTYTFVEISTPPTYHGSTGGVQGKITYQKHDEFFGQARTFYNLGPLHSSFTKSRYQEWYTEIVGGYCFEPLENWTITPYGGLGIEFMHDHHHGHHSVPPIKLRYNLFYAVAGFDTHYSWTDWMLGLQADCLPMFNQYLRVKSLYDAAWVLKNRVGADVRLPIAYRYVMNFWLELTPYYRYLPIGRSKALELPHRNENQWGAFLTFRFFL